MIEPDQYAASRTQVLQFGDTLLGEPASGAARRIRDGATIDHYVVLDVLGAGAMGEVYLALDVKLDRNVAIKVLHADRGPSGLRFLRREALALAQLAHPNVVAVHDVVSDGDELYVVMEYVPGRTLADCLGEAPRDWRSIVDLFIDAGRGLAAAHAAGLVHRDFKPANVMVSVDEQVKVMDFGIACATTESVDGIPTASALVGDGPQPVNTAGLLGTPRYMAPEQWLGEAADARADIFAFSAALWEALFDASPFAGRDVRELAAAVCEGRRSPPRRPKRAPAWLRRALERGLARDPARRWPTMDALLRELGRDRRARRRRIYATASLAVLGAAVLGLAAPEAVRAASHEAELAACQAESEAIEEVFGTRERLAILGALPNPLTVASVAIAEGELSLLDSAATRWHFHRRQTCLERGTSLLRGAWSQPLVDRCFDRVAEEISLQAAEAASDAPMTALRDDILERPVALTNCNSLAAALAFGAPLPENPSEREAWRQARAELLRIARDPTLGSADASTAALERLVADAAARGFVDVEADAVRLLARRSLAAGRRLDAREPLRRQLDAREPLDAAERLGILEGGADGIDLVPALARDVRAPKRGVAASPLAQLAGGFHTGLDLESVPLLWGDQRSERPLSVHIIRRFAGRIAALEAAARLLVRVGDDARAAAYAQKGLEVLVDLAIEEPVLEVSFHRSAGLALARSGELDAAAAHLRAAAELAANQPITAARRGGLELARAELASRRGDLDAARRHVDAAAALRGEASAQDDLFAADLELARGRLRLRHGDLDAALPHLLAARRMLAASWGAARIGLADANAALAVIARAQGRLDDAEAHLIEATQSRRDLVGDNHRSLADLHRQRADLARARGEFAAAAARDRDADALVDAHAATLRDREVACGRLREFAIAGERSPAAAETYEACVATGVAGLDLAHIGMRVSPWPSDE